MNPYNLKKPLIKAKPFLSIAVLFNAAKPYYWLFVFLVCTPGCNSISKEIQHHRDEYKAEFLTDPRSPLKEEDLQYLDFFPANKAGKVNATCVLTPTEEPFEMPTYSGITRTYRKWCVASFRWEKDSVSVSLYENMTLRHNPVYQDYLFLPFKDETNGVSTYGGGRYLNMSKADTEDGRIIIDFNKCYNPWCAYSDGFNCPIPPRENHLSFSIEAGEKMYKGKVKSSE
jgi:uncharacterized protein